ncbi:LysR substrate-binding domain-containing protein [Streptomyces sp. NPDC046924]|uniref:LysR family transcriptional regulator n=1 Tax=Streptomyces sp. NPDC046924 TaxID=3155136 RepID=UPI0033EAAA25
MALTPDLHRLHLLCELKHRGTLAAVAQALSYSPSTISQQLNQLASEVGVPLLEPVGRRVRLTAQAEILVRHAEAVLARLDRAEAEIAASLDQVVGVLRVAAFQTAATAILPRALSLLRHAHPGLRIQFRQMEPQDALSALLTRDCDLAITEEYPGNPGLRSAELEHVLLCGDTLRMAHATGINVPPTEEPLMAFAEQPWVMEPEGRPARRWAVALCRAAGFEPQVHFESPDPLVHLRLVEEGHATAILPDFLWRGHSPHVVLHDLPPGRRTRELYTVVRQGRGDHPAIRSCRDALRRAATALAGQFRPTT